MKDKIELLRRDLDGYRNSQLVASQLAQKICAKIENSMSEADAHAVASEVFKDAGVTSHWHHPVIGFGPGTRKIRNLRSIALGRFMRRRRKISIGDLLMVDIAPIINGYPSDYTETHVFGENAALNDLIKYTRHLADRLVNKIPQVRRANDLWHWARRTTSSETGYELAHPPIIWLGHRIQKFPQGWPESAGLRFLFLWSHFEGSFVSATNEHPMRGLWAIEPYILGHNRAAKWEELVYYDGTELIRLNPGRK